MTALAVVCGSLGLLLLVALVQRTSRRFLLTAGYAIKHGLALVADRLRIRRLWRKQPLTRPQVLRAAFEDLGPTYIKFGQIIASSPGLFTAPYVDEFRHCLDRVRPFGFDEVLRILHAELGPGADRLVLEERPLASASIAQVHAARTQDGQNVVVKVQRPRIEARVVSDVRIMHFFARVGQSLSRDLHLSNPVGVVEDFGKTIQEELDFRAEARNMDEFNRIMGELGHDRVCAPRVIDELTTRRVLTMERFFGHKVDDVEAIRGSKLDAESMLLLGMRAWFQSVMLYGLFHGDVHAGNLMWLDDGRIGFLDFGIVGRFDDRQRRLVTRYIMSLASGQYRELSEVVIEMGAADRTKVNLEALAEDMAKAYGPLRTISFGALKYSELLPNILAMARKHGTRMPSEFILIVKQILYFDRYAKLLAPDLNVFTDPRVIMSLASDMQKALGALPTPGA